MAKTTVAKKGTVRRRRERKNIERGAAHIQSTFNNTIVTITDTQGNALFGSARHKLGDADIAAAYTTAYAEGAYMGMHISDLHFYARWDKDSSGVVRVTSLTVTITVADADNNPLCSQKAIVPLPGQPRLCKRPRLGQRRAGAA